MNVNKVSRMFSFFRRKIKGNDLETPHFQTTLNIPETKAADPAQPQKATKSSKATTATKAVIPPAANLTAAVPIPAAPNPSAYNPDHHHKTKSGQNPTVNVRRLPSKSENPYRKSFTTSRSQCKKSNEFF